MDQRDPIDEMNRHELTRMFHTAIDAESQDYDFSRSFDDWHVPKPNFSDHDNHTIREAIRYIGLDPDDYTREGWPQNVIEDAREKLRTDSTLEPMMNSVWPMREYRGNTAKDQLAVAWNTTCCIVEIESMPGDHPFIAMTGGGMDLSWDLAEAYMRCNFLPPTNLLPLPDHRKFRVDAELLDKNPNDYTTKEWVYIGTLVSVETVISQKENQLESQLSTFGDDELRQIITGDDFSLRTHLQ